MRRHLWLWLGPLVLLLVAVVAAPRMLPGERTTETGATWGLWRPWLSYLLNGEPVPRAVTGPAKPPVPVIEVDGQSVRAVPGTYCWRSGDTGVCADSIEPTRLVERVSAPVVAPGATVSVRFPWVPNAGSMGVERWGEQGREAVSLGEDGTFQVPVAPGRYVYEVHGRWPPGDASYAFVVTVPGDMGVASIPRPPAISVRVGGVAVPTVQGGYCWSDGGLAVCTDTLSPGEQLAKLTPPVVAPGSQVAISFAVAPRTVKVARVLDRAADGIVAALEPVTTEEDSSFRLPERPGRYVYEVDGRWAPGSASYGFQVEVR